MKNLSPINENKDVVTKEYVDGEISNAVEQVNGDAELQYEHINQRIDDIEMNTTAKDEELNRKIALNSTTLGYQCKNLIDWKNAAYSTSLRLTQTKTESGISVTSTGSWAVTAYMLPILEVGTNYIFSATISKFSVKGGKAYIMISTSTSSSNIVKAAGITSNGTATIKFEATSDTMYVLFIPNYSDTFYTNSFTASDIMLRYADITDNNYEPYKPSVDERINTINSEITALNKNFYINYVYGKSTSDYYDYVSPGVMIYVASEGTGVDTGGIYFINANGYLISFIQKTGIVIEIDSSNHRFRVTNNTSKMICVIAQTLTGGV